MTSTDPQTDKATPTVDEAPGGPSFPRKVLVATDGSEDAAVAVRAAVSLARKSGASLHVVHVFEFVPAREFVSLALRIHSPLTSKRKARETLEEQVALIEKTGTAVAEAHLRLGSPVDEILTTAEKTGADLVVVGSRGLGGVERLLMGSVSERVVQYAGCPVLVLRSAENCWPPKRVIVGDDGSPHALRAGALGAGIGGLYGARAMLAQVYPRALESRRYDGSPEARLVNEGLSDAEGTLMKRAAALESALGRHLGVRLLADEGSETIDGIAMTLLDAAREAEGPALLVVGSRGLSPVKRMRLGSVSTKVVRAARGPVLVCPPGPDARENDPKGEAASERPGP